MKNCSGDDENVGRRIFLADEYFWPTKILADKVLSDKVINVYHKFRVTKYGSKRDAIRRDGVRGRGRRKF